MERSLVDTNVILRYLLQDDAALFKKASAILEKVKTGEQKVIILESVLTECVYVLLKVYKIGRPAIADFGGLPTEAWSGALVAQAAPSTTGQVPVQDGSTPTTVTAPATPGTTTTTVPSQQTSEASKGPAQQTKGVGNLSNLATKLGQRGVQLFLLGLTLILGILIYMTFSRARKAGKAR